MSYIATQAHNILDKIFEANPHKRVFTEHYVRFKNTKLFFDFYVPECCCLFEIQGQQHFKFVKHFHGDKDAFLAQKFRDNLKLEYIQNNPDLHLIRINYNEEIDEDIMRKKIMDCLESEDRII